MPDITHFDTSWNKLVTFAAALRIRVVRQDEAGEGCWVSSKNLIRVDTDLDDSEALAVLLHELGHAMDELLIKDPPQETEKAYGDLDTGTHTTAQTMLILDHEMAAWKLGRALAKRLKIRLGRWFDTYQSEALKSYQEV